jgi:hypothetical protein
VSKPKIGPMILLEMKGNQGIAEVAALRCKNATSQYASPIVRCFDTYKYVPRVGDTQWPGWRQSWAKVMPIQCVSVSGVFSVVDKTIRLTACLSRNSAATDDNTGPMYEVISRSEFWASLRDS